VPFRDDDGNTIGWVPVYDDIHAEG
jgi:hypothetical protein